MLHSFGTQVLNTTFILLLVEVVIGDQGFGDVARVLGRCSQSLIAPHLFTHYLGSWLAQFLMLAPECPLGISILLETALLLVQINDVSLSNGSLGGVLGHLGEGVDLAHLAGSPGLLASLLGDGRSLLTRVCPQLRLTSGWGLATSGSMVSYPWQVSEALLATGIELAVVALLDHEHCLTAVQFIL